MKPYEDFENYWAKIKNIYLELNDYSYYHNPSEIGNIDRRFLGREDIINRLRSILTNNETKSGAYLITGYRGMGKSSFVNRVISDISFGHGKSKWRPRLTRILLALFFICMFNNIAVKPALFAAALSMLFLILLFTDSKAHDLPSQKLKSFSKRFTTWSWDKLKLLGRTLILEKERVSEKRIRAFASDLFLVLVASAITELSFNLFLGKQEFLPARFIWYLAALSVFLVINIIYFNFSLPPENSQERISKRITSSLVAMFAPGDSQEKIWERIKSGQLGDLFKSLTLQGKRFLNYSHRFYVNINLGYDNLKEIDILRLIAKNIQSRYEKVDGFIPYSFTLFIWRICKVLMIFLFLSFFYFYKPIYQINQNFRGNSFIYRYFPSQTLLLLDDAEIEGKARELEKKFTTPGQIGNLAKYQSNETKVRFPFLQKWSFYCDQFLFITYRRIQYFVNKYMFSIGNNLYQMFGKNIGGKDFIVAGRFKLFPEVFDYLFLFYLFVCWSVFNWLFKHYRVLDIVTHGYIHGRIRSLNERIEAQITKEKTENIEGTLSRFFVKLSGRKQKAYPIASERDIEMELIDILNLADRVPRIMVRPQFVFIFDELDKIEPHKNTAVHEKELEQDLGEAPPKEEFLFSMEETRRRRQTILTIMANLKYFLTTAKSKFIFIAGREMYDAALADVSDRHFFMGSIFNDVIYVNSFMSDPSDRKLSDITTMTEEYVCSFLLPKRYHILGCSLHTYNLYLQKEFFKDKNDAKSVFYRQKREKIICILYNFIVYITYRSNGAPKKITQYLEKYIGTFSKERLSDSAASVCMGRSSRRLYLFFGYYDQYIFGMITYLANPFLLSINKSIKDYGDKLLVSTSFLVDHLYKYHRFGFSWRNLELMPEILDIHRAPNLREMIRQIIDFLSYTHITVIVSGLYNFKFIRKVVEEISFLSKISEEEAAAFNFTLDESLSMKRHFHKRMQILKKEYQGIINIGENSQYVHSLGYIQMILGDLHFYDEEYDDALIEYMDAVQTLRHIDFSQADADISLFLLVIRNMLKLGFTLEKKRIYDSAFGIYGRLTSMIIGYRKVAKGPAFLKRLKSLPLTPNNEELLFKISFFEGIRLIFQPFLARFHIIEKLNLGGISYGDIAMIEKEFQYLVESIDVSERFIITAEFYNRVGNILFYKNSISPNKQNMSIHLPPFVHFPCTHDSVKKIHEKGRGTPCLACQYYRRSLIIQLQEFLKVNINVNNGSDSFKEIISSLTKGHTRNQENYPNDFPIQETIATKCLANTLSNLGDILVSCLTHEDRLTIGQIRNFVDFLEKNSSFGNYVEMAEKIKQLPEAFPPIEKILFLYYFAALYFRNAGDRKEYVFQLVKILHFLRNYLAIDGKLVEELKKSEHADVMIKIEQQLVIKAIKEIYQAYDNTHRIEIRKVKEIFNIEKLPSLDQNKLYLNQASLSFDIKEIIYIYLEMKMKLGMLGSEDYHDLAAPYNMINSMYNRIIELRYKANFNFTILSDKKARKFLKLMVYSYQKIKSGSKCAKNEHEVLDLIFRSLRKYFRYEGAKNWQEVLDSIFCSLKKYFGDKGGTSGQEVFEFLVLDSIFCFHEIIKSCHIYGISYMINHSLLGYAHMHLGNWCEYFEAYQYFFKEKTMNDQLCKLIGAGDLPTIQPTYHYEMALRHFRKAKETHSQGKAYREMIEGVHYLNDDFNDTLPHFCAAMERYQINSGKIDKQIDDLKQKVKLSTLYVLDNYLPPKDTNRCQSK